MRYLEKIRIRKAWIPDFLIHLKGYFHGKKEIVVVKPGDMICSPYLLERQSYYVEYTEKLKLKAESLKEGLSKQAIMEKSNLMVDGTMKNILEQKLKGLSYPIYYNEYRVQKDCKKKIQELEMKGVEAIAKVNEIEEMKKQVECRVSHLLQQNLAREKARAYTYLTGVQKYIKKTQKKIDIEASIKDAFDVGN